MTDIRVPLRDRQGSLVAEALLSPEDAALAAQRWCLNANGYAWRSGKRGVESRHVYLHRAVVGCVTGDGVLVDHINRDRLDNRRSNLRPVTPAQSRQNTPSLGGTSSYRGVTFDRRKRRWRAQVQLNRQSYILGRFATEAEAAAVVSAWRREHMPFSEADR